MLPSKQHAIYDSIGWISQILKFFSTDILTVMECSPSPRRFEIIRNMMLGFCVFAFLHHALCGHVPEVFFPVLIFVFLSSMESYQQMLRIRQMLRMMVFVVLPSVHFVALPAATWKFGFNSTAADFQIAPPSFEDIYRGSNFEDRLIPPLVACSFIFFAADSLPEHALMASVFCATILKSMNTGSQLIGVGFCSFVFAARVAASLGWFQSGDQKNVCSEGDQSHSSSTQFGSGIGTGTGNVDDEIEDMFSPIPPNLPPKKRLKPNPPPKKRENMTPPVPGEKPELEHKDVSIGIPSPFQLDVSETESESLTNLTTSLFHFLKEATNKSNEKVLQYTEQLMEMDIVTVEDLMEVEEACNMNELPFSVDMQRKVKIALHKHPCAAGRRNDWVTGANVLVDEKVPCHSGDMCSPNVEDAALLDIKTLSFDACPTYHRGLPTNPNGTPDCLKCDEPLQSVGMHCAVELLYSIISGGSGT